MNGFRHARLAAAAAVFLLSPGAPNAGAIEPGKSFQKVVPGMTLSYPKDHGSHPSFKTEWWYFTGHLTAAKETKPRFGFELVFFRSGLPPGTSAPRSAWAVRDLYFAHFAVTDDRANEFFAVDQSKRSSFGGAGAAAEGLDVWNGKWRARMEDGVIRLEAAADGRELRLELRPEKPIVLHGEQGFSKKGAAEGEASYYSSFTRLRGSGTLRTPRETVVVDGASAWMDQEFTSSEAGEAKIGWDWFALQLADGREVMLYQLRDSNGTRSPFSGGSVIEPDGSVRTLHAGDYSIAVLGHWTSEETGITYPAEWRLEIPSIQRRFHVLPTVAAQELTTSGSTGVSYWEGRCRVDEGGAPPGNAAAENTAGNAAGNAYVELVGYTRRSGR